MRFNVMVVMLVACGAPERGPTIARAPAPPEAANAAPVPVASERRIVFGDRHQRVFQNTQNRRLLASTSDLAESDLWSPCLRDFVRAQPEVARRALTQAFSRLEVACDKDGRIVLGPPHGYRGRSHLGYRVTFAAGDIAAALVLAICDGERPGGDAIAIEYDGARLPLPRLDFERELDGCHVAPIPPSTTLARTLPDLLAATDVAVRFGTLAIDDLAVTQEMLRDLRLVFDALDAVALR